MKNATEMSEKTSMKPLEMVEDFEKKLGPAMPTTSMVSNHLNDMLRIYESTKRISDPLELYVMFLYMEKEYADRGAHNFAETVHLLHPQAYQNYQKNPCVLSNMSMMERLRCPSCSTRLKPKQAYDVHLMNVKVKCRNCSSIISYEAMCIATFCKDYRRGRYGKLRKCRVKFSYNEQYATWKTFTDYLNNVLRSEVLKVEKTKESRRELSDDWRDSLLKILVQARTNISKFYTDLIPGELKNLFKHKMVKFIFI